MLNLASSPIFLKNLLQGVEVKKSSRNSRKGKSNPHRAIQTFREIVSGLQIFSEPPGILFPLCSSNEKYAFRNGKESIVDTVSRVPILNEGSLIASSHERLLASKNLFRLVLGLSLLLLTAGQASAQYGGGGGTGGGGTYTAPAGGYSSAAKGAGIGAGAAAGVGALFLAMHYHGRVTGCVQPGDDGLRLLDEKNNTYALVPGDVYVKPGQRVLLKGKTSKGDGGTKTFTAKKLVKDLGSCGASQAASSANTASK